MYRRSKRRRARRNLAVWPRFARALSRARQRVACPFPQDEETVSPKTTMCMHRSCFGKTMVCVAYRVVNRAELLRIMATLWSYDFAKQILWSCYGAAARHDGWRKLRFAKTGAGCLYIPVGGVKGSPRSASARRASERGGDRSRSLPRSRWKDQIRRVRDQSPADWFAPSVSACAMGAGESAAVRSGLR